MIQFKLVNEQVIVRADNAELLSALVAQANDAAERAEWAASDTSGFLFEATDDYARRAFGIEDIAGLDADDVPFLNYQTQLIAPGYWRLKWFLHSSKLARVVAQFETEGTRVPSTLGEAITLSKGANGSALSGWANVSATLKVDWTKVEFDKPLTTYTTAAATGIRPEKITPVEATREQLENARLREVVPARVKPPVEIVRVGPTADFTTVVAAVAALEDLGYGDPTTRSTWPVGGRCAITRPVLIDVIGTAHTEQVIGFTNAGIDQSPLRIGDGMTLRTRPDALFYMDSAGAPTAPVFEINYTGRLEGEGTFDNRRGGYVGHLDNGGLHSLPDAEGVLRRLLVTYFGKITLRKTQNNADPLMGMGIGAGQLIVFDGTAFDRVAGTGPMIYCHTSPNPSIAGEIAVLNCLSNAPTIALAKSHAGSPRHGLRIVASDVTSVTHSNENGTTGSAWIRRNLHAGTTYDAALNP
jgi:hypothetical protein